MNGGRCPANDIISSFDRGWVLKTFFMVLFVLPAFSLFLPPPSYAATMRISAPKIELELAPGETYSGEIVAENPEDEAINCRIYLEDWEYITNGTGEKKFAPAGTMPLSASKWISFAPATSDIPSFGRITARYTITVPPDAKGTYFAVLFFETILGSSQDEDGVSVLVAGRIGSLFFITIKDTARREGDVRSVEIKAPEGSRPMEITTVFKNTGNTDITLGGNFLILDGTGKVMGRGDISKIYTFPGAEGTRTTQWIGKLPPGDYTLLITYDLGKGQTLVEEQPLKIQ